MMVGTYLDLFTGDFDSACFYDSEEFVQYLKDKGKNILSLTADPEVPYFINAVVEEGNIDGINWNERLL